LNPPRSLARHPLFQVMLALQSNAESAGDPRTGLEAIVDLPGLRVSFPGVALGTAKFDLAFHFRERYDADGRAAGLDGPVEYSTHLLDHEPAADLAVRLRRLLEQVTADPSRSIADVEVLDGQERLSLVSGADNGTFEVPDRDYADLFAERAALTPDA